MYTNSAYKFHILNKSFVLALYNYAPLLILLLIFSTNKNKLGTQNNRDAVK